MVNPFHTFAVMLLSLTALKLYYLSLNVRAGRVGLNFMHLILNPFKSRQHLLLATCSPVQLMVVQ